MDSYVALLAVGLLTHSVHDVYTTLRSRTGALCCSGHDCEAVTYRPLPSGDVIIFSRRHNASIRVPKHVIVWLRVPGSVDSAHWCGARRAPTFQGRIPPVTPTDPDQDFVTHCAFIDPGGS